jgi:hypothetical protein
MDATHRFLSAGILRPVVRFDRFFSDERELDLPRTSSFIRWRNTLTLRDDGRHAYSPDLLAEFVLPNLDRRLERLRLSIATGRTSPLDPLPARGVLSPDLPDRPHASLLLSPFASLLTHADLQAGLLFRLPVGWFGRARLRRVQPFADVMIARLAVSGYWRTDTGWGTRQDASVERPLAPWLLLRLSNAGEINQRTHGYEWSSELALLAADWPRTALSISTAALGRTRIGPSVEAYRVQVRARHDLFRRWVFVEVNPEVVWTRFPGGRRLRASAVMVVLEFQFASSTEPDLDVERVTSAGQGGRVRAALDRPGGARPRDLPGRTSTDSPGVASGP